MINGRLLKGGLVITEQLPMSSLLGLAGLFYFQCLRAEPNLGHRFFFSKTFLFTGRFDAFWIFALDIILRTQFLAASFFLGAHTFFGIGGLIIPKSGLPRM